MRKAFGLIGILVFLIIATCIWEQTHGGRIVFITQANVRNLLTWVGLFGVLSLAQSIVIIIGGIDLSVGSVVGLIGISAAMMLDKGAGWSPWVVVPLSLLLAAVIGLWHGLLITRLRLQPFVVTLCGLFIFRGIARLITADKSQGFGEGYPKMSWFGRGTLADLLPKGAPAGLHNSLDLVPAPFLILLLFAVLMAAYLHFSPQGRHLFALGANEEAARFSGIRTDRLVLLAYVLCSVITGLGGLLLAFKTNSLGPSNFGSFYELYAIAGAVLGGCSLRGGSGNVLGVVIGASLIVVLRNLVNILEISSQLEYVVIGGAILIGVAIDELFSRRGPATSRATQG